MNNDKIIEELRNIKKLLALSLVKEQSQVEQIEFLSNVGFQPKEIAEVLNTSANSVRVTLSRIRKKSPK
ncbi:MAG: sigma factor-like helix-turn-helix DNA-binding protein [Bacteroidetes bacterium]|nr:sigma factor-like helix-turn-helix DNA-binding protein [Bacteroidota bacterium]